MPCPADSLSRNEANEWQLRVIPETDKFNDVVKSEARNKQVTIQRRALPWYKGSDD